MKSSIRNYIGQYGKDLEKYSRCISPRFKAATIHRFRTATKKLRSILRWQNFPKDILPSSFVKMYHASGDLRNMQLLLISLNEDKTILPDFMLWLATSIGNQEMEWDKTYNKKTLQKLQHSLSKIELQKPGRKATKLFFSKRIDRLKAFAGMTSQEDEMLHDVRKMVKDMQYIKQWCRKNWAPGTYLTKKFSLLQLEKLGKLAGDYNDKRTGLLLLNAYLDEEKDEKAINAAGLVQKKHQRQKAKMKKQLLGSIDRFCKRVQPPYFPLSN